MPRPVVQSAIVAMPVRHPSRPMEWARQHRAMRGGQAIRAPFVMTDDDWLILASLKEPTHLGQLSMCVVQRCLHLYKAGYLYTDPQGWVVVSLHGKRELGRRTSTK